MTERCIIIKKITIILTAALIAVMLFAIPLNATDSIYTVYDDCGNSYDINENDVLVVIYDADGNVVATDKSSRMIYVNGSKHTIPAGGSLVTYQYQPTDGFFAGFYFVHSSYSGDATTRNRNVTITVRNSASVGGTRYNVKSETYSTNEEDNTSNSGYLAGIQPGCRSVQLNATSISSSRPYYDAKYVNNSSSSVTISLLVGMD